MNRNSLPFIVLMIVALLLIGAAFYVLPKMMAGLL